MDETASLIQTLSESDRACFDEEFARERVKLRTAYWKLLFGGPVGLHHRYLRNDTGADTSRSIAWLLVCSIFAIFLGRASSILAMVGLFVVFAIWLTVPITILVRFIGDACSLPKSVSARNTAIQEDLIRKYLPRQNEPAAEPATPLPRADAHQLFHKNFQRVHTGEAYKWLFIMGAFGVHKDYLGERAMADQYLSAMAMPVWLLTLGPIYFCLFLYSNAVSMQAWLLFYALTCTSVVTGLWLIVHLVIDLFIVPKAVAARNVQLSQQVLRVLELQAHEATRDSESA